MALQHRAARQRGGPYGQIEYTAPAARGGSAYDWVSIMGTRMTRNLLPLMVLAAVPLAAVVGCSHGKSPTTSAASPASTTPPAKAAAAARTAPATAAVAPAHVDMVLLAGAAFDGCKAPTAPPDPPDGHVATRAQMLSSHKLTADFNTATNQYLSCLNQASNTFDRQYGRLLPISTVRQIVDLHDSIHNKAVDADKAVADKFNAQLRIYKARGGAT